jgi:hypothetical protein
VNAEAISGRSIINMSPSLSALRIQETFEEALTEFLASADVESDADEVSFDYVSGW